MCDLFGPFQLMLASFAHGTVSTVVLLGGRVGEGCDVFFNARTGTDTKN